MYNLSFHDRQHLQKMLANEQVIAGIFDEFILSVSPQLKKWANTGNINIWIGNAGVEKFVESKLVNLHSDLLGVINHFQMDAWKRSNLKNDEFIRQYIEDMAISEAVKHGLFAQNLDVLKQFQQRKENGMNLSQKVWNLASQTKTQLEFYLESGLSVGRSAATISQDVRQILNNPDKKFHRIRDKKGNLVLSQPMKDYHPGTGQYRSSAMNALRLTATETNMMYRKADSARWEQMDFILGIEIRRSENNHGPCKICDGMVGKYPKTFKFTGFHPFCICFATPIVMEPEAFADFLKNDTIPQGQVITDIPQKAKDFVSENKDKLQSAIWYRDNFNNDGELLHTIQVSKFASSVILDKQKFVFTAKTPQEAIDYIKANIADDVNLDIRKTDLSLINDIINQLQSRMDEFGISKFSYIGVPSKKSAVASWDEFDNSLKLNLSKLRRPSSIWKNEETWLKKGIKYSAIENEGDVIRSVIDHELGHKLFSQYQMEADAIHTFSKAGITINGINEVGNLGYYASTQVHEYFAEAFSMFMGPGRAKVGKETGAMIDRLMDKVSRKLEKANKSLPRERKSKHIKTDEEKADIQKRWVYRKVSNMEREIRMNKKFETGVVFDWNGNVIIDKRGAKYSVAFTDEDCAKMKDCIFTHNHPRGWGYPENSLGRIGNSFSPDDIYLAISQNVAEIRAVTPNYTFIMKRPEKGWGISTTQFKKILNKENEKLKSEFYTRINNNTLTPTMASAVHYHVLWRRVAEKMGWSYIKAKTR